MTSGNLEERRHARWLITPSVALFSLVAIWPLFAALALSLQRHVLVFGERRFIGLDNYAFLLTDVRFGAALFNTVVFTAASVSLEVALALPLALALNTALPARGAIRAATLVPWVIPTVVSARIWGLLFDPELGPLTPEGVNWLGSPGFALLAAIVADAWKSTPFVTLLLLAGLQGIPEEIFKAARVDGASRWQIFWRITLPLLKPSLLVAVLFRSLDAFRVFDIIFVLTGGGPAHATETLSVYAYKTLMRAGDFGYGATLSVATFVLAGLLSALLLALFRPARRAA